MTGIKIWDYPQAMVFAQTDGSWHIEDELMPSNSIPQTTAHYSFRLHWLLCNAPWEWEPGTLTLFTKKGICTVEIHAINEHPNFN
jgi:hypothetical protein